VGYTVPTLLDVKQKKKGDAKKGLGGKQKENKNRTGKWKDRLKTTGVKKKEQEMIVARRGNGKRLAKNKINSNYTNNNKRLKVFKSLSGCGPNLSVIRTATSKKGP